MKLSNDPSAAAGYQSNGSASQPLSGAPYASPRGGKSGTTLPMINIDKSATAAEWKHIDEEQAQNDGGPLSDTE
jgi:hypothetical protein